MFNQLPRSDLRAVHVAVLVDRESLRCTGRLEIEDIGDEIQHFAVGIPADPNAALPSRMHCIGEPIGLRVGYVDHPIPDGDAAGAAELLLCFYEPTVLIEDLDAHVAAIGDPQPPLLIHRDVMWRPEFRGA